MVNSESNGKVALVTGANKGLGFEMSRQLAQQGLTVIIAARKLEAAVAAATKLKNEGLKAEAILLDINDSIQIQSAVQEIKNRFGKLDVLINNAGVMLDGEWAISNASSVSVDMIRKTFDTNFFALVEVTQAMLPLILKSQSGRIVNMASIEGSLTLHADPSSFIYDSKPFAYDASKAAVNSFTVHLAHELRNTPVKVNSAHPGWVKIELGGDGAMMDITEGAKTGVQLATLSDDGASGGFFHLGQPVPW
ncbi:MAG: SDR family oxidoreductase [Microcoleus sp. PH2017_29_MFU_D_A]|uniref:SDR family oxidoreductase n=1 Tax=unclassified Microcoleus TaxID=2642155 RepID=UPI001D682933|nr:MULTISPECIES: SDR family oxidoreductase [unclassified Microcoleus]TAE06559.1 MAG: SDR family oxidoreductase [Oscillatoriales cyanobacterium]MCC3494488.1 SDR family oxidoreductase [Microcoleus sp. PH2017_16_JOR_D_A]MCC3501093.1 SDR family oxidoreductase [Microcoleus sp. PH2017_15_JOR_U_A]MCC3538484.1 SDR family oxidoreductase [Microcoleus sp. PH2017_25_DOB_D_A]MCC3550885.1 SDR family oxidoreductase [Microcoleus sp. PH2017_24_DOB_U_A]